MSQNITFRIKEKDNIDLKEVDQLANKLGLNRTELIIKALEIVTELDSGFIKNVERIAEGVNLSFAEVIQGFVIRRLAEIDAKKEVWESDVILDELMKTDEGAPDIDYLYQTLKSKFKEEHIQEKIKGLLEKERAEERYDMNLLSEEEKEFLIKHKAGQTYYNSKQYKKDINKNYTEYHEDDGKAEWE